MRLYFYNNLVNDTVETRTTQRKIVPDGNHTKILINGYYYPVSKQSTAI